MCERCPQNWQLKGKVASLMALNTGEEVQLNLKDSTGETATAEMKWTWRCVSQTKSKVGPSGRSLRSCKRLLMGFGFICACRGFSLQFNNLLA